MLQLALFHLGRLTCIGSKLQILSTAIIYVAVGYKCTLCFGQLL